MNASDWINNSKYLKSFSKTTSLNVANDVAEHCIRQVQIKRRGRTKSTKQFSNIPKIIWHHYLTRPTMNESSYYPNPESSLYNLSNQENKRYFDSLLSLFKDQKLILKDSQIKLIGLV